MKAVLMFKDKERILMYISVALRTQGYLLRVEYKRVPRHSELIKRVHFLLAVYRQA